MKATPEQIQQAKELLSNAGYATKTLWHIDDVKTKFKCTDGQALEVIDNAVAADGVYEAVWEAMEIFGEDIGLVSKED